jgi:hypothetical protein
MSRSGYVDDWDGSEWDLIRWRGAVASAIRGKRGQALLRELRAALDAMADKRLIREELIDAEGGVCALGCLGVKRGIPNLESIDATDYFALANTFGVSPKLIQEIEWENDEAPSGGNDPDAKRWEWMRKWVERHIQNVPAEA